MSKVTTTITFTLPEGTSLQRLILNEHGTWDACCVYWASADKYGVAIPTQFGYAFKQHKLEKAIELAAQDARDKFIRLRNKRNSRPAPGSKPKTKEEELNELLDLI